MLGLFIRSHGFKEFLVMQRKARGAILSSGGGAWPLGEQAPGTHGVALGAKHQRGRSAPCPAPMLPSVFTFPSRNLSNPHGENMRVCIL